MERDDAEEYTAALGQVCAGGYRQVALGVKLGVPQALGLNTREWVEDRLGGYVRLSIEDRRQAVAELGDDGMSNRQVADVLGVDEGTIRNDRRAEDSAGNLDDQGEEPISAEDSAPSGDGFRDQGMDLINAQEAFIRNVLGARQQLEALAQQVPPPPAVGSDIEASWWLTAVRGNLDRLSVAVRSIEEQLEVEPDNVRRIR